MFRLTASLALIATLAACGRTEAPDKAATVPPSTTPAPTAPDIHSYARPGEARVSHLALDLRADFDARVLAGTATLRLTRAPDATQVVLDTRDLTIESVASEAGEPLKFSLGAADRVLGQPLTVELPQGVSTIVVTYRTSPSAAALQWLTPEQTAGKR